MSSFTYFAYGSNMSTARLGARVKIASVLGPALLPGHTLRFHKRSGKDGTGKCNALFTGSKDDEVIGVLFGLPKNQRRILDDFEGVGKGYDAIEIEVIRNNRDRLRALTYLATADAIDDSLRPTAEYRKYVEEGAREFHLPQSYIDKYILSVATCPK